MTLRDLTPDQVGELQKSCLEDFRAVEVLITRSGLPPYEIWQKAFSRGVLAGLNTTVSILTPPEAEKLASGHPEQVAPHTRLVEEN